MGHRGRKGRRGSATSTMAGADGTGALALGRRARLGAGASLRRGAPGRHARQEGLMGGPGCRGQRERQATADWAPRGGCSALRAELSLPLVCNDRFRGLDMHEGNYLHWLVTARVNSQSEN